MNSTRSRSVSRPAPAALSPFASALSANITAFIRSARAEGTTGIGLDCLRQCVKTPSPYLDGAPRGTNAAYFYAEVFAATVAATPAARGFVLAS